MGYLDKKQSLFIAGAVLLVGILASVFIPLVGKYILVGSLIFGLSVVVCIAITEEVEEKTMLGVAQASCIVPCIIFALDMMQYVGQAISGLL